jgi:hypothetical protein
MDFGNRTVEYFIPMANTGPRGDIHHQLEGMFKKVRPARPQPFWLRGAYMEYVSTAKWRERRWRLFSTFPQETY